jgi:hypothetical protein
MNKIYISKGNSKAACPIFNLPAIKTCKSCLQCHKFCYARKAEYLYPKVKPCRDNNLKESKKKDFAFNMWNAINIIILKKPISYFRIHESGDFYSEIYIKDWYAIAERFKSITFYCYTKRNDLFTKALLKQKPSNLIIYFSIDGIQEYDESQLTTWRQDAEKQGYNGVSVITKDKSFCPAQLKDNVKCMENCFLCALSGHCVVFKKH